MYRYVHSPEKVQCVRDDDLERRMGGTLSAGYMLCMQFKGVVQPIKNTASSVKM